MGAEPGDYLLAAERPGRVRLVRRVTVGADGLEEQRLEMERGLAIVGRLLDVAGQPAVGHVVEAVGSDGFERATVRADGSFRLEGLTDRPYVLSTGSSLAGFAVRAGVRPGPDPVHLVLRPAGKVTLRVVTAEGRPVAEALASVVAVDGTSLDLSNSLGPPTDSLGITELGCPAGDVAIAARAGEGVGLASVAVRPGETVALDVVLRGPATP
jgi:hypothetical protein